MTDDLVAIVSQMVGDLLHRNFLFYSLTPELAPATVRALDAVRAPGPGLGYYEFGLFKGYNLWFAERVCAHARPDWIFHGFDSFEGMPPNTAHPDWAEGNYAASEAQVLENLRCRGAELSHITLHKGWFSREWFAELAAAHAFPPVAVAVVDCDLYESAVPVLGFLGPLLRCGSVLLFDDWKAYGNNPAQGEQRAWAEFCAERPGLRGEVLFDFGKYGHALRIEAMP